METLEDRSLPAPFTPGNLVIYRVGDGTAALSNAATAVFLDEYTPSGTLVQSLPLPTADSGANQMLTASGTATTEGQMTVSADGQYLLLTGYDAALGTATVASTTTSGTPRTIGRVAVDGTIDTSTTTTSFSGVSIRSATSTNGTDIWAVGANTGVVHTTLGGSGAGTIVSNTATNLRVVQVFGSQLYVSSGAGTIHLGTVGTGTPTTSGQIITALPGFPTSGTQTGFYFADLDTGVAGVDTLYVASDDAGALTKYSLVSGSWTSNGTIGVDADDYRGLTASISGTTVTLYAIRKGGSTAAGGGEFVKLVDSAGYNGAFSGTPTLLFTTATNTALRGVSFTPVSANQPPVVTTSNGSTSYTENAAAVAVDANITVTDANGGNLTGATVQITSGYVNGQDVLAFTNANGITGTFDAATGTLTLSGTASVANYETALRTVTYANTSDNPTAGDRTVTFIANDGTANSPAVTKTVTVTATNDAPVVTTSSGSTSYTENGAPVAIDANVTVTDVDSTNLTGATVQITSGYVNGQDILAFVDGNGITGSFDAATGTLTLSGSASVANYQAALRTITYANTSENPNTASRTVTFTATDGTDTSTGATKTVTVVAVNDPPIVTTSTGSTSYTENAAPVTIDTGLTIADVDSANLTGATIQITSGYVNGQDVLAFTNTGTITGTFDAATGTLTLSGSDTLANYQTALRAVTYANTSDDPATADRTITFTVNDGTDTSTGATKTVTVTAVNDAPTLTTTPTNPTFTENGASVSLFSGTAVSTTEAGQSIDSLTLTVSNVTDGTSEILTVDGTAVALTNGNSVTTSANGLAVSVALSGSTATVTIGKAGGFSTSIAADTVSGLAYQNTSDAPTAANRVVTLTSVRDTGGGSDTTTLAIGSTVSVVAVNDAPVLAGANNFSAINEDPTSNPGTLVSTLISGQVTDPDGPFQGIAITATATASGSWEYTVNGTTWNPVGAVSNTSALLLAANANTRLRFVPNLNFNGIVTSGLTFRAWDQSTGTAESLVDVSTNGGASAFSSATASASITVNSVNDAPAGTDATVTTNEDTAYTFTAADFGFSDSNDTPANALAAVRITTLPTAGALTNNGSPVTAGQFVSAADIAAGNLRFTPAANASGTSYASFTFQVQDNGGTTNSGINLDPTPNTLTINVSAVNDLPTLNDPADTTAIISIQKTVSLTGITAGGGETQTLTVTATSNNTTAVPNPTVSYTSPNAIGSLTFTPTAAGTATITVRVTDDNGTPANPTDDAFFEQTFLVTVPANQPPVNTAPAAVSATEDTAFAFTGANAISIADPDNTAGSLTTVVSIPAGRGSLSTTTGSGTSITISGSAADVSAALATLVYTPPTNANNVTFGGPVVLAVSTTDALGANDTDTVNVNVAAVNDVPSFTLSGNPATVAEDAGSQTVASFATNIAAGPATATDETSQTLTFVVTNNTNPALFSVAPAVSASGTLTYTPAANANSTATITLVLMDNGGGTNTSAPQTFTITVTAISDAPVGTDRTATTNEETTYTFSAADFGFTDPDSPANALLAVKIATLPVVGSFTFNGSPVTAGQFVTAANLAAGALRFTPAVDVATTNYTSFTFQVQDNGGTANGGADLDPTPNTLTINVAPINDAPSLTLVAEAVLVLQNSGPYTQDNFTTFAPGGGADETTQTVTYAVTTTNNSLFSVQPAISPNGRLTFTPAPGASGTVTVTVVAVDSGAGGTGGVNTSPPQQFTLTVSAIFIPSRETAPLNVAFAGELVALGTDVGTVARVAVVNAVTGAVVRDFFPFGTFSGGARPALADVNGDGTTDIVVATASQLGLVAVYDGATGGLLSANLPFGAFPSGVQVATGDIDGDGRSDIVIGLDSGAPIVGVISGRTGEVIRVINAIPGFAGGVRLAVGDVTGDNRADIVTVAGPGGNGLVVAYDGMTGGLARAFFAYPGLGGEVSLALGDVTGDGLNDIVAGIQVPGGTFVGAFTPNGQLARGFFAPTTPPAAGNRTGRVTTADVTGDRVADLLVGSPPGTIGNVMFVVDGAKGTVIDALLAFEQGAFNPLFGSGVFIKTN